MTLTVSTEETAVDLGIPVTGAVPNSAIRVFLVVENRFLRESLARLFRKRSELTVVGQVSPVDSVCVPDVEQQCDVLVGDSFVPGVLAAQRGEKCDLAPGLRVVLIGMAPDEEQFMTAVRAGVHGYLLADASAADVIAAVRAVVRGESVCPPRLCSALFTFVAQAAKQAPMQSPPIRLDLTLRQQQLLALVAKGLTNKEIAAQLNLSEFTVRNHIHRAMKQLDAENRTEAVEAIRAHGYLSPV